jgi:hypothetical protein
VFQGVSNHFRLFLSLHGQILTYYCYFRPCLGLEMINSYTDTIIRLILGTFCNKISILFTKKRFLAVLGYLGLFWLLSGQVFTSLYSFELGWTGLREDTLVP